MSRGELDPATLERLGNEMAAIYYERYYVDDAALRLYSAGEHVANALIFMLGVTQKQLRPYRKNRTSQQGAVGRFLADRRRDLPLSRSIGQLARSPDWRAAMTYRNEWVHEQPPTVQGLGIVYHRRRRWRSGADRSLYLGIGGGDSPKYTTTKLIQTVRGALDGILRVLDYAVMHYDTVLEARGIRRRRAGMQDGE